MQDLYEVTHENVHLAVRDGITALYVERIYGTSSVSLVSRAGVPLPLHATGVGKVLFAYAAPEVIDQALQHLPSITRYTIVERGRMQRELAAVRRNGYGRTPQRDDARDLFDRRASVRPRGLVIAALGLVTSTRRRDMTRFVPALQVAASTIGRSLQELNLPSGGRLD